MAWMACVTCGSRSVTEFSVSCAFFLQSWRNAGFRPGQVQQDAQEYFDRSLLDALKRTRKESGGPSDVPRLLNFLAGVFDHEFT